MPREERQRLRSAPEHPHGLDLAERAAGGGRVQSLKSSGAMMPAMLCPRLRAAQDKHGRGAERLSGGAADDETHLAAVASCAA